MKNPPSSIYIKLFVSTTLSILVSLLVTSTILYVNFEKIALRQVYANDMETLIQTGKGVGGMKNMAVTLSNQIYSDLNVARLMYYAEPDTEALRTADVQLTNYRLSLPFIDSVYVYNGKKKVFYVNSSINRNEVREAIQEKEKFDDAYINRLVDSYRKYKPYRPIPRTFLTLANGTEKTVRNYYTFLMYDAFARDEIGNAVIINFSEEWITGFISNEPSAESSKTFILDGDGVVVSDSEMYPMMSDVSGLSYIKKMLASDASGSFMETIRKTEYLVTYTEPDLTGWRYVKLTPKNFILSRISRMKYVTILIGLALLALGTVASMFLTKRLYVPIDSLMTTLQKLSLEEKKNVRLLRQVFFRDIFLGRGMYDGQTIEIKLEELGTAFHASGYYRVVLLKIDRYLAFSQDFTAVDQSLIKAAIMESCAATIPGKANHAILDMGNNGIAVILNSLSRMEDLSPDVLEERLVALRNGVREKTNLSVSLTVSDVETGIENLQDLYGETLEASLYRMYRGHGCIISAREIRDLASDGYEYPSDAEKRLVSSLLAGKTADAREQFDRIISGTNNRPINVFNLTLSRLTFAVDEAAKAVRKYNGVELNIGKNIPVASIGNAETIADITAQFYALFDDIGAILLDRKTNRNGQIIDRINRHIETGYMRQDLYIDSIAEYLDKSPTYISHVYKQCTGTTILDKIINVRMGHANELLLTTELSVAEISERTGFSSSSYFFKVFRKVNGMTPNEFRERKDSKQ